MITATKTQRGTNNIKKTYKSLGRKCNVFLPTRENFISTVSKHNEFFKEHVPGGFRRSIVFCLFALYDNIRIFSNISCGRYIFQGFGVKCSIFAIPSRPHLFGGFKLNFSIRIPSLLSIYSHSYHLFILTGAKPFFYCFILCITAIHFLSIMHSSFPKAIYYVTIPTFHVNLIPVSLSAASNNTILFQYSLQCTCHVASLPIIIASTTSIFLARYHFFSLEVSLNCSSDIFVKTGTRFYMQHFQEFSCFSFNCSTTFSHNLLSVLAVNCTDCLTTLVFSLINVLTS